MTLDNDSVVTQAMNALCITPAYREYGTTLFSQRDAYEMVSYCERSGIVILGIDGFRMYGDKIEADPDLIADFSSLQDLGWREQCKEAAEESRFFLEELTRTPEVVLDFTLASRP